MRQYEKLASFEALDDFMTRNPDARICPLGTGWVYAQSDEDPEDFTGPLGQIFAPIGYLNLDDHDYDICRVLVVTDREGVDHTRHMRTLFDIEPYPHICPHHSYPRGEKTNG